MFSFRSYRDAFGTDALVATDNRYGAACAAVRVATGDDAHSETTVEERHFLQQQARNWLLDEFIIKRRRGGLDSFAHWLVDPDLVSVRDPKWLAAMPESERKGWEAFWSDVQATLKQAAASPAK